MALEVGVRQKEGDWKEALLLLTPKLDVEHIYELGDIIKGKTTKSS